MKVNAGNLKKGEFIMKDGTIWRVEKAEFYAPGKGSALMRSRVKEIKSGKTMDLTYKSNETIETVDINTIEMQYLYKDAQFLHFMNERTYEQIELPIERAGTVAHYLKEGDKLFILLYNGEAISLRPPQSVRLKVIRADEAIKGNTVSNARKPVTVENGAIIQAPLFIKVGDTIVINPETGDYIEREGKQY